MKTCESITGNTLENGWMPHKPETWAFRYARLRHEITMRHYEGRAANGDSLYRNVACREGCPVKIVMVSRFGDVGITEDLDAENGYGARVQLSELRNFTNETPACSRKPALG